MRKERNKKLIFILIILAPIIICFMPVKFAVRDLSAIQNENYILVRPTKTTGFSWQTVEEINDDQYGKYIALTGKIPPEGYNLVDTGDALQNKYVCYGEYIGEDVWDSIRYPIFNVTKWDIVYPVKRESIFWAPKGYLTLAELIF